MTPENIYNFIVECDGADITEMRRLFRGKGTIRKTRHLINVVYFEDLGECGQSIYKLKTTLSLQECLRLIHTGSDLHYAYETINTPQDFTGERTYCMRH